MRGPRANIVLLHLVGGVFGCEDAAKIPLDGAEDTGQDASNAGDEGAMVVQNVKAKKGSIGYNADSGEYEDMLKAGVIDPVKVVRGALENAASIAAMILTTDALITDAPEKDKPAMPAPGGGMGGDF